MKLFALLLLVLTAIAAAVPAPLNVTAADGPLLDITVDVDSIATGGEPKAQPGFWPFDITFHETYNGGSSLIVTADFWWVGGSTKFNFINSEQMVWVRVNSRDLQIFYDFKYHDARFMFDSDKWFMEDLNSPLGRGLCSSYLDQNKHHSVWDKEPVPVHSSYVRNAPLWCGIDIRGMSPKRAIQKLEPVAARANTPDVNTNLEIPAVAQPSTTINTGDTVGRIGYYDYTLSVTEYCEASEGTPLKARGWWSNGDASAGQKISFGDSTMATELNLGYPGVNLRVGPYDYWTHRVGFHYGGCNFDQDIDGVGDCGLCTSSAWSSGEINCAMNPSAGRTHNIECRVAVAWDNSLAARNDEPISVVVAKATVTRTIAPEVIVNPTGEVNPVILPFHFSVTEYCQDGSKKVKGRYSNALVAEMDLPPGLVVSIAHTVPNYPPLQVGPFNYDNSHLRFHYADKSIDCEWFDDETWKQCGECRAALWSGGSLNCAAGGGSRTKEMDCSFILGNN